MRIGDWIEHLDSPSTKGIVVATDKDGMRVLVHAESEPRVIRADYLEQWWEPLFVGDDPVQPPAWVKPDAVFVPRFGAENFAVMYAVRPGWVAYWVHAACSGGKGMGTRVPGPPPIFMLAPWNAFNKAWMPRDPPTAWSRLLEDDPCHPE